MNAAGVNLLSVAEACNLLSACGGDSDADVVLTFPGRDNRLVLETATSSRQDSERVAHSNAFAAIVSEEPTDPNDIELASAEYGNEPNTYDTVACAEVSTSVLKEIVDDVQWAGDTVHVELQPQNGIKLSSGGGSGQVAIECACACSRGSSKAADDASVHVKHNHLKHACSVQSGLTSIDKGCSTRVTLAYRPTISEWALRVTHYIRLSPHRAPCSLVFIMHPVESVEPS